MNDTTRDRRLRLGAISLVLGGLGGLGAVAGILYTAIGVNRVFHQQDDVAFGGACIALAALLLSLAGLVVGVLGLRRPPLAPAGTRAATAGVVTASLGVALSLGLITFAFFFLALFAMAIG